MTTYIPPYPERLTKGLSTMELLRKGRESLLSIWSEKDFQSEIIKAKLFKQHIIIANSPDTVRHAFVTANASFERKSHLMERALRPLIGDGLFISYGQTWRTRRRMVGSIIHGSRVPAYTELMVESMVELREQWTDQLARSSSNKGCLEIDMLNEMAKLTADVISRAIFGRNLGKEHAQSIAEGFSEYQKKIGAFNLLPMLGLPNAITYLFSRGIRRSAKRITTVLDDLVSGYSQQGSAHDNSVLDILFTETPDGKKLTREEIRNEAAVIFMAGHETTANCLAWAWFLLSQAPECEKKMHQEIDSVLQGRAPVFQDVSKLVYTRAIIEETLRLYPPIPILSRQSGQNERLGKHQVPKGAIVAVIPWLLHRHKLYWDNPDHFIPERFLPSSPRPNKYSYLPFSIGPRVCAGMSFGLTEAVLGLAILSQVFKFQLAPNIVIQATSHLSLRPDDGKGGLPMILSRRNPHFGKLKNSIGLSEETKVCEYA